MILNYRNDEMMKMIPHTDSRFRRDIVLYELNELEQSEREKTFIEEEQRRKRKQYQENGMQW